MTEHDGLTAEQEAIRRYPPPLRFGKTETLSRREAFIEGAEWATEREKARAEAAEAQARERETLLAVEHDLKALAPHSDALAGWWYKERIEEIVLKLIALREHGEAYTEHHPSPPRHAFDVTTEAVTE